MIVLDIPEFGPLGLGHLVLVWSGKLRRSR